MPTRTSVALASILMFTGCYATTQHPPDERLALKAESDLPSRITVVQKDGDAQTYEAPVRTDVVDGSLEVWRDPASLTPVARFDASGVERVEVAEFSQTRTIVATGVTIAGVGTAVVLAVLLGVAAHGFGQSFGSGFGGLGSGW